jgi:hypothetical protein
MADTQPESSRHFIEETISYLCRDLHSNTPQLMVVQKRLILIQNKHIKSTHTSIRRGYHLQSPDKPHNVSYSNPDQSITNYANQNAENGWGRHPGRMSGIDLARCGVALRPTPLAQARTRFGSPIYTAAQATRMSLDLLV